MKVAAAALALLVCLPPAPAVPATPPTPSLEPGKPITRKLAHGETHRYRIELAAGSYLRATIQTRGIGLIVTLARPDGSMLTGVDVAPGSPDAEALVAVAVVAGTYSLDVRPLEKNPAAAEYQVTVEESRSAGPPGQALLEAQMFFVDAERAKQEGTASSLAAAVDGYRKAAEVARAAGAHWWEAHAAYGACEVQTLLDRNQEALDGSRQVLTLADALGADRLKARTLNLRGGAQKALGDPAALPSHEEALGIWTRLDDPAAEAQTHNDLAIAYYDRGEKQRALDHYVKGLALIRVAGDKEGEAYFLHNLGTFYQDLGDFQRAREYYEQALALRRAANDRRGQGLSLAELGRTYLALGETQKALETAREGIRAAREAGDRRGEGSALTRAGRVYEAAGDRENAMEHYRLARDLYRAIADPQGESDVLSLIGRWHLAANQPTEALDILRQSLAKAQAMGDRQRTMIALYLVATAERGASDLAAARSHSEASIALSESLRGSLPDHQLRGSMLAWSQRYFDFHIDLLMEMHRRDPDPALVAAALEANERSRARSLLELLTESGRDLRQDADPALRQRDLELEKRLDAAAQRQVRVLAAPHTQEEARAVSNEIQDVTREHDLAEAQMRAASPEAAAFRQPQPLTLAEIQRQVLDDRTLLLEYHLGADRSHLWAVTRETVNAYELPKEAEIEAAARRWHELLSGGPPAGGGGAAATPDAESDELRKAAAALSVTLMAPAAGQLADRRLLIVADGALQYVPFAALPSPGRADTPLVVDHEVVSAPSASLVAVLRRQLAGRLPAKKILAVLADPVFDASDERIGARAQKVPAATAQVAEVRARDLTRAATDVGLRDGAISRLPFTRREAKAILSLVPAGQRMEALDFSASRDTAVSPELGQYRYVHFATHGFADSAHPELSGIVLSLVDRRGREQSGFLPASQVFNLKLPAELVVLSGCRTALGKEIRGEGLLGLTRAFMSAGAGRVVASLWKVDDAATAELMKTMYDRILRDGQAPAQALRSAQIAMWRGRRWTAPYYWAAFVIQGEWN